MSLTRRSRRPLFLLPDAFEELLDLTPHGVINPDMDARSAAGCYHLGRLLDGVGWFTGEGSPLTLRPVQ